MATWEDGPEYAPLERPDEFVASTAPPLSQADPYRQPAGLAPVDRPVFADPPVPVAPLATLVPQTGPTRDPGVPFAVVSSTMTADSDQHAWGGVHYTAPPAPPPGVWGPPGSVPRRDPGSAAPPGALAPAPYGVENAPNRPQLMGPAPTDPFLLSPRAGLPGSYSSPSLPPGSPPGPAGVPGAPHVGPFPAPGTPGWFAPPPGVAQPPAVTDQQLGLRVIAASITPGVLICLLLGGLITGLAPLLLVLGALLATRVRLARSWIQRAFAAAVAVVVAVGVLTALTGPDGFSSWWGPFGVTAQFACWALLATCPLLAVLAWQRGERPRPAETTWG